MCVYIYFNSSLIKSFCTHMVGYYRASSFFLELMAFWIQISLDHIELRFDSP